MWLEEYIPSEWVSEDWWTSAEQVKEASEKYKKHTSKSKAWIKRVQKDEKKAKTYDILLAGFLVKIIVNKKFNLILDKLIELIHDWYPSNFILWVLSLIYPDISVKIREIWWKKIIKFDYISQDKKDFDDNKLNPEIKIRINQWIEDIIDSVSLEYSVILTKRLIWLINNDQRIILFVSQIFTIFLSEVNINISLSKSQNISEFILKEVLEKIKKLKIEEI